MRHSRFWHSWQLPRRYMEMFFIGSMKVWIDKKSVSNGLKFRSIKSKFYSVWWLDQGVDWTWRFRNKNFYSSNQRPLSSNKKSYSISSKDEVFASCTSFWTVPTWAVYHPNGCWQCIIITPTTSSALQTKTFAFLANWIISESDFKSSGCETRPWAIIRHWIGSSWIFRRRDNFPAAQFQCNFLDLFDSSSFLSRLHSKTIKHRCTRR